MTLESNALSSEEKDDPVLRRKNRVEQKRAMPNREKSLHKIVAKKFSKKSSLRPEQALDPIDESTRPSPAPSSRKDFAKAFQMGRSLTCILNDMNIGTKRRGGCRRNTMNQ